MTDSELMTVMVGGMAHVAGSVMGAYVGLLGGSDPAERQFFAKHLLTASVMAAPATFVVAKILMPETGEPLTRGTVKLEGKAGPVDATAIIAWINQRAPAHSQEPITAAISDT